jgi:hypothetical protein
MIDSSPACAEPKMLSSYYFVAKINPLSLHSIAPLLWGLKGTETSTWTEGNAADEGESGAVGDGSDQMDVQSNEGRG